MLIGCSGFGAGGVVASSYGLCATRGRLFNCLVVALPEGSWVI
jgi:hypothetical protein